MQKVMNYGSFLQSFALKKTIEEFGHQCEFIDIEQGRIFPELKRTLLFLTRKVLERYCKWDVLRRIRYTYIFQQRFLHEFFEMLGTNIHTINFFDVVVIGSDEVFNFAQRVPWGYTLQLFGKVSNANKVISYAGSFGHTTIWDIEHYGVKEEISGALNSMRAISVRDANSCEIVEKLTRNEPQIHVDPVLMFDYLPYVKPIDKKDYIIIYTYPNRIRNKKEIEYFSELIKINNEVGYFTTRLTGITNEMIEQEGKDLVYVLYEFKKFLGNDIIIGHNVNFDIDFIYDSMVDNLGEYLSNDYIDTLRISRKLLPELKHHKLDNLIDYFNLAKRNEHRALNDCVLTNQVYINLVNFLK